MNTDDCILFFYDEYQYVSCNEINEQCPVTEMNQISLLESALIEHI